MKTSIKIKKFYYSALAADGGMGSNWTEVQSGQRENSVSFTGSDADTTNYKNVEGATLESSMTKGDKTLAFQLADLTPDVIADFMGGTVTTTGEGVSYDAPSNENQYIEKSVMFLTEKNVLFRIPRVRFDAFPAINDDDLHYHQINGVVLRPEKTGVTSNGYDIISDPDAALIKTFAIPLAVSSTVDDTAGTVAVVMPALTDVTALVPQVVTSLGALPSPRSGIAQNFTTPQTYTVTSASGESKAYIVTVTLAS